ncbi:MAG TPA: T9SS type A sorting domain-containing protein, partial [Puia sp.]|nr:T9SS type A sorting domain-containing protein [Puia sp.]
WQTEAAATTQYFDVERSVDGTHFYSIGQVAASADTSRYDFTDQLLSSDGSAFFYRLRIYDQDGGNNYSNIIRVNTGNTTATLTTRLAPNPAHGNSTLYVWSGEAGTAQVSLWTSAGALVYSRETALTGGNNAVDIRLPDHLPTGIYLVKTVMGAQSATSRLVVE